MSFVVTLVGPWRSLEERRERKDKFGGDWRRLEEPREHTPYVAERSLNLVKFILFFIVLVHYFPGGSAKNSLVKCGSPAGNSFFLNTLPPMNR